MSMTHKERMRRCIEECKTCGNLNTASGAERLIEKFAEQMDEVYPASSAPHQQLVTDGLGVAKWEDKNGYLNTHQELVFDPAKAHEMASGGIWYEAATDSEHPELLEFNTWMRDNLGSPITVVWDGVRYDLQIFNVKPITNYYMIGNPGYVGGSKQYPSPPFSIVSKSKTSIGIYYLGGDTLHTLVLPRPEPIPVPISEDFIPTSVPVIQSASVGQTVVVKAVDENGKPTEWEAVDGAGGGGGAIQRIESTDTENMVVLRELESGSYVLYGRFKPYPGADSTMTFSSGLLVNVIKRTEDTQIQIFYPVNNCVQHLTITDTEYTRKDVYLNDLQAATAAE